MLAPNLSKQVEEAGSFQLPDEADSQRAADILTKAGAEEEIISLVFVLDEPLDEKSRQSIADSVSALQEIEQPITGVMNSFANRKCKGHLTILKMFFLNEDGCLDGK